MPKCLSILVASTRLAFDLEFDRDRYTYGFDLCLIQIATPQQCFVIDPLGEIDVAPLFRLLETSHALKLVHCPGEDLRLLHSLGCYPTQLADTEVVARLLNYEQTSLSSLLQLHCNVVLNKKLQTSNWGRRPLSMSQIDYAAADVLYLFELYDQLYALADQKQLLPMVQEEMAVLNTVRYSLEPKTYFLKKNDRQFMSAYDQFVLNELFVFRDELARKKNKPAHQIMAEEWLRQIAYKKIAISELTKLQGVHPMLKSNEGLRQFEQRWQFINEQATAQNLSRKKAALLFTSEEREAIEQKRNRSETARKTVFIPIQQHLSTRFGEHTSRYLLSTTLVNDLLKGDIRITQLKPAYRQQLISDAAAALELNIEPWW
jgi:ribonuclease D